MFDKDVTFPRDALTGKMQLLEDSYSLGGKANGQTPQALRHHKRTPTLSNYYAETKDIEGGHTIDRLVGGLMNGNSINQREIFAYGGAGHFKDTADSLSFMHFDGAGRSTGRGTDMTGHSDKEHHTKRRPKSIIHAYMAQDADIAAL